MPRANIRPIAVFLILACACAAYMAGVLQISLRFGYDNDTTPYASVLKILVWVIPVAACAAVQLRESGRRAVSGPRLWLQVAAAAFGAPLVGVWLMLVVVFNLFGKSP